MGKKATICIMTILMGSGLLAAYHSDSQNTAKLKNQMQYQSALAPVDLDRMSWDTATRTQ